MQFRVLLILRADSLQARTAASCDGGPICRGHVSANISNASTDASRLINRAGLVRQLMRCEGFIVLGCRAVARGAAPSFSFASSAHLGTQKRRRASRQRVDNNHQA